MASCLGNPFFLWFIVAAEFLEVCKDSILKHDVTLGLQVSTLRKVALVEFHSTLQATDFQSVVVDFRIPKEGENIYNYRHRCNCKISGSELDDEQIRW